MNPIQELMYKTYLRIRTLKKFFESKRLNVISADYN